MQSDFSYTLDLPTQVHTHKGEKRLEGNSPKREDLLVWSGESVDAYFLLYTFPYFSQLRNITLRIRKKKTSGDLKCFLSPILWLKVKQTLLFAFCRKAISCLGGDGEAAPRAPRTKSDGAGNMHLLPLTLVKNQELSSEHIWLGPRTRCYLKKCGRSSSVTKSYWKVLAKTGNRRLCARQIW